MEVWKDVIGYEGLYQISDCGCVRSIKRTVNHNYRPRTINGQTLKFHFDKNGYPVVCLSKNGVQNFKKVHRLVAEAFIQNPLNLPFVNHRDERKTNCTASNLEWCTSQYNNTYGKRIEKAKLSQQKRVLQYTKDHVFVKEWASLTEASRALRIHNGSISECCRGKRTTAGSYVWKYGE